MFLDVSFFKVFISTTKIFLCRIVKIMRVVANIFTSVLEIQIVTLG